MSAITCPSCNGVVQASDAFVGKSVLCPHCQRPVAIPNAAITASADLPMHPSSTGLTTPEIAEANERRRRELDGDVPLPTIRRDGLRSWLNMGITFFVILVIVTIVIALFVPAVARVREAAARTQSINNLKQIGLASHGFHDANKRLPFNGSDIAVDGDKYSRQARPGAVLSGGWAWTILPYIDSEPFFVKPPEQQRNDVAIRVYLCPGRGRPDKERDGGPWSDYFYNNYLNDPKQAAKPDAADHRRKLIDITDGSSNTIMVGHGNIDTRQYASDTNVTLSTNILLGGTFGTARAGDNGEVAPGGVTLQRDSANAPTQGSWGGPFPQGALMCMGDATVRMFPYTTANFSSFLTPTGKEEVKLPDH